MLKLRQSLPRVIECAYFTVFFFLVLFVVNPEQSWYLQQPLFLFDGTFLAGFLSRPGGLTDCISLFLSQFFRYRLAGALILTAMAGTVSLITGTILKHLAIYRFTLLLELIPATALLYLYSSGRETLATTLVLLFTTVLFYGHLKLSAAAPALQAGAFLVASSLLLYAGGGGGVLLLQLLCLTYEWMHVQKSRSVSVLAAVVISGALPYLAARFVFFCTLEEAYLHLLIPDGYYRPDIVVYLLYGYYPLLIPAGVLLSGTKPLSGNTGNASVVAVIVQTAVLGAATIFPLLHSLRSEMRFIGTVTWCAHEGKWKKVLNCVRKRSSNDRLVNFSVNRALYHTGRLPYDLFRQRNFRGEHALFLGGYVVGSVLMDNSELYFELGHVRAARQWAYEARTVFEYSPRVLKMLALTNVVEGDYDAAAVMLRLLAKSLMHKKWAQRYLDGLQDTASFGNDPLIREKRGMMPSEIFFMDTKNAGKDLLALLEKNSGNRMAFEYLMAYLQLSGKPEEFDIADEIACLKRLGYREMPQTYQEALMVYVTRKGYADYDFGGYAIDPVIVDGYRDFMNVLQTHRSDPQEAAKTLYEKYALSYWYYLYFTYPLVNNVPLREKIAGK